jgi:hypothetical protein
MYTYSSREPINNTDPLTIYRSPQDKSKLVDIQIGDISGNASKLFSAASTKAGVSVSGPQPDANGQPIYVVTTQGPAKFTVVNGIITQTVQTVITFDAQNYRILGSQMTMAHNGQVINLNTQKVLSDELLPDGTKVAWDLSDLQGVKIMDDADRSKGDLLPEVVQRQDLAAKTQNAYLLKTVPAGMVLVISAPPKQENESTYIFVATYRSTNGNDYLTIQSGDAPASLAGMTDETYTTQADLTLSFLRGRTAPDGKSFTSAVVSAPDGTRLMLNSTLPRERVKQLAETLDRVR